MPEDIDEYPQIDKDEVIESHIFPLLKSAIFEAVDKVAQYNGRLKCHKDVQEGNTCSKCGCGSSDKLCITVEAKQKVSRI